MSQTRRASLTNSTAGNATRQRPVLPDLIGAAAAPCGLTLEQEPFLVVRSLATTYAPGYRMHEHAHDWRQLLFASAGAMTVYAGRWSWMTPPGKAVFIPAGCRHSIHMWGSVAMRSLYFPPHLAGAVLAAPECGVVTVTPLLRELILRIVDMAALDSRVEAHRRLLAVLLDEMEAAPVTPLALPLPEERRALATARDVLARPDACEHLETLARRHGAGRRTLERQFRKETGMSFGLWRQKARMLAALRTL